MGIYVHGMKMPQFGGCIVITSDGVARKYLKGDVAIHYDALQDTASAIEVPPHGRLGDLDLCAKIDMMPWDAPTIIPPEGGDAT